MTSKNYCTRSFLNKEQGLSQIELIVISSLLLTLLALAYNFLQFGFTSFVSAEKRSNVQQNVRLATDFIHNEIRFATSAELLGTNHVIPAAQDIGVDTHYILLAGSKIEYRSRNVSQFIPISIADEIHFNLNFIRSGSNLLSIEIRGQTYGQQPFSLSSQVRLENLSLFNRTISGKNNSTAIRFVRRTINPPLSLSAQPGAVVAGTSFNQTFTLTLLNETFSESFGQGSISLGGDFSGLSVTQAKRTAPATATVALSGNLTAASGSGQIKLIGSGLTGGTPLSTEVSVVPGSIFTLNILHSGNGSVTPQVGSHLYPQGTTVTLTATATAPWQFHQWQIGNNVSFSAQQTILMNSDKTATARFRLPLTSVPGGSYVSHNGITYLKLTGANNRVMRLNLSSNDNWSNTSSRPSRSELEGGIWTNSLRIAGVNAYWTNSEHNKHNTNTRRGIYVSATGVFDDDKKSDIRGVREALSLPGILFAYSGSGTLADPFILNH